MSEEEEYTTPGVAESTDAGMGNGRPVGAAGICRPGRGEGRGGRRIGGVGVGRERWKEGDFWSGKVVLVHNRHTKMYKKISNHNGIN